LVEADATDVLTAYKLRNATRASSLAAGLRRAMSNDGYVIPIGKKTWQDVRITVDLRKRELLAVVEGGLRMTATSGREAESASSAASGVGSLVEAGLRTVHIGDARSRPGATVGVESSAFLQRDAKSQSAVKTSRVVAQGGTEDDRMYRIRVTPQWEVTSTHRSRREEREWSSVASIDDEPFIIEVDGQALEQLGLKPVTTTPRLEPVMEETGEEDLLGQAPRPDANSESPDLVHNPHARSPDAFGSAALYLLSGAYADADGSGGFDI
jgi:hypothetical protein